jgi:preprotein translocase subunit SecE
MAQAPTKPGPSDRGAASVATKKVGPIQFAKEVRSEVRKISWSTRSETLISTVFVFIMVVVAALFFFATDAVLRAIVGFVLNIGGGQ